MSNTQPNYFSIIPASVRYDKDLPPMARLLFSELTALCNKEGYCWANNKYFADLYDVTPQTVSKWISDLSCKGYIKIEFEGQENGTNKRQIFIDTPLRENPTPLKENHNPPYEKDDTPLRKGITPITNNRNHNNTFNNTLNKKREYRAEAPEAAFDFLPLLPVGWDSTHFQKLVKGWITARGKKKPTEYAKELAITDLIKFFPKWEDARERMEKAIKGNWLDLVFKEDKINSHQTPKNGKPVRDKF